MRSWRLAWLAGILIAVSASPAGADVTGFLGFNTTPSVRPAKGFAIGSGFTISGFEFEYSSTSRDEQELAPSLTTGMGNILLQTPIAIHGRSPISRWAGASTANGSTSGGYELRYQRGRRGEDALAGPMRLRVDYRVFKLGSGALYSPAHRIYAGLNLKF